jgi:hypothetical protein
VEVLDQDSMHLALPSRIYHTLEPVDSYPRLFERALLLTYYQLPEAAIPRITGHSPGAA